MGICQRYAEVKKEVDVLYYSIYIKLAKVTYDGRNQNNNCYSYVRDISELMEMFKYFLCF